MTDSAPHVTRAFLPAAPALMPALGVFDVTGTSARKSARATIMLLCIAGSVLASEPARSVWILSPPGDAQFRPDVHSVDYDDNYVTVRSSGISLKYLGALQSPPAPPEGAREFVYRIPLHPEAAGDRHSRVPTDVIGTFVNGLPIYNQFAALSWNGANIWRYDPVAARQRDDSTHSTAGLLEALARDGSRQSPIIGFALDGFPVYGPWAAVDGRLRRMRSSYRLRAIQHRHTWPDGTQLTPEQYGPDVSPAHPLGTFAEDYEYVKGSGDLDKFNGRYVDGAYAYFLSTTEDGRLAFPYLIGPRYYGRMEAPRARWYPIGERRLQLSADRERLEARHAVRFRLVAPHAKGDFEYVHEKPVHFLIASADLADFDHIHPELAADDSYQVAYTFPRGGKYRVWADYSLPGEAPRVDAFDVSLSGPRDARGELAPEHRITLAPAKPLRAGEDIPITLQFAGDLDTLQPYLGAWAHVIVIGEGWRSFAHAHPLESAGVAILAHTHNVSGPPPREIHIATSFPDAGAYKMWVQYQRSGEVITEPFVLNVAAGGPKLATAPIPAGAIRVQVSQRGFEPLQVEMPANQPTTLAFTRDSGPNCGSEVVFPTLGIRAALPLGKTTVVELPAQGAGELRFACGMGMYRGMIVVH
jgi:hypothetical protein